MKKNHTRSTLILLFFIAIAVVGCIEQENLYDPNFQTENPLDLSAPDDFDWSTVSTVQISVEANDEFDGAYYYSIAIYDNNPIAATDSIAALAKGVAKEGQNFTATLTLSKETAYLYIEQTDPRGRSVVKSYPVSENMTCDFSTTSTATKAASSTRAVATRATVNVPDYTVIPSNAVEISTLPSWASLESNGNYKMTKTYNTNFNYYGGTGVKLYISGTWNMPSDFTVQSGLEIIVMNGAKIVSTHNLIFNGSSFLTIMPGGSVSIKNLTFYSSENECKNWGDLAVNQTITASSGGLFYSKGTVTAKDATFNSASPIQNEGKMTLDGKLTMPSGATLMNSGEMTAADLETNGLTLTNEGTMIFNKITGFGNSHLNNNCYIESGSTAAISGCVVNFNKGYMKAVNLTITGSTVNLFNGSMIEATKALDHTSWSDVYDGGTGARSLLKAPKMDGSGFYYNGNLTIEVNTHPVNSLYWQTYHLNSPAQMVKYGKSNVVIEVCTGTANGGNPGTDPSNPTFPVESVNNTKYTYLFEDQWPIYGDYDMNDIVLRINKTTMYLNSNNKVEKFKIDAELLAVGASKTIAAAIQLDDVAASTVSSVEYSNKPTSLFSFTGQGLEDGQSKAVIPLFASAHRFMGSITNNFINTVIGSNSNVATTPTITITALFNNATLSPENFSISKLNPFIITDGLSSNRKEVHVATYHPTDRANPIYFGNHNDATSVSGNKYYVSKNGLAWGILVPTAISYPKEYADIKSVFSQFANWVLSGGAQNTNWYTIYDTSGIYK